MWDKVEDGVLFQGDYLPIVDVPIVGRLDENSEEVTVEVVTLGLIVLTQSCDLQAKRQTRSVALCPAYEGAQYANSTGKKLGSHSWQQIVDLKHLHLHALADPNKPDEHIIIDFAEVYSLATDYIETVAQGAEEWWRLRSPWRESLSQRFGFYFSRVALPD